MAEPAFYLPTDDPAVFRATHRTAGPWSPEHQHAGPPSALVTRAIERAPSSIAGPAQLTRLCVDILGPVPVGEVTVEAAVIRPGRTVELVEGELSARGRACLRVRAWRMRTARLELPVDTRVRPAPARPDPESARDWGGGEEGYLGSVEWRFVSGHARTPGPASVWCRLLVPLVAGEEPTGLQRLVAVADSGNGISGTLPWQGWWFINTDLTIHLHRVPRGEWTFITALSTLDETGVGLAETELFDADGRVGRGAQSLMVGPRDDGSAQPTPG